jgi:hypothetical protein
MRSPILVLLGCAVLPPGCFTYPCDRDVLACEEGEPLAKGGACDESEAPLVLELGEGEGTFTPLADDTWPQVHHGVQGGIHFMLGLRLEGVDAEHASFEIEIEARDCKGECASMQMLSTRTFVVDETYFEPDGEALVLADVVLLLDREPEANGEITVRVTDSCGRTAETVHAM